MKRKLLFIKLLGFSSLLVACCIVAFGLFNVQAASLFPNLTNILHPNKSAQREVLAEATKKKGFIGNISFNIPAFFQDKVRINADTYINGMATVSGRLTAPNVLYGLVAGPNITISAGQNPTISASFSAVTTLQGESGNLELVAGEDITIDGLTISNKSTLASVYARGGCDECLTDDDIADSLTIGSDGNIHGGAIKSGVVAVSVGGTGATSFTTNGVLYGNGTSPLKVTAAPSAAQILLGNSSGIPTFADMTGDVMINSSGITTIQADAVALGVDTTGDYQAGTTAGNGISVAGTSGEGWSPTLALGTLTSDWDQTGAYDIALNNSASELKIRDAGGTSAFGIIDVGTLGSGDRNYVFPDFSGSSAFVCLSIGNCSGSGGTITGGGTMNFLTKWTTGSTLSDSIIYDDGVSVGIGTTSPLAKLHVSTAAKGKALVILNETGNQDILTASASGVTKFTVDRNGNMGIAGSTVSGSNYLTAPNFVINTSGQITTGTWNGSIIGAQYGGTGLNTSASTGVPSIASGTWSINAQLPLSLGGTGTNLTAISGGIVYSGASNLAISSAGTSGQCLTSGGSGAPVWQDCATGTTSTFWNQSLGALYPQNSTVDFLVGGQATTSAKFAVINVNSGTPTASLSAGTNGATFLTATGNLQTTAKQSLTLGGGNTGNIVLSGFGTGIVHSNASGVLSSSAVNLASGDVTGTLGPTNGGTGLSSYTTGDLIFASATNTLSQLAVGASDQVLGVSGGLPAWISTSSLNYWQRANGALAPINITDDFLLGATSTTSAKIGLFNIAGGTPTASLSANSGNNATFLTGAGNLGTRNAQTLSLGGSTTGDVTISGRNGANNGITFTGYSTGLIHADANGRLTSSAVSLSGADVTGTLAVGNGGTGVTSLTTNGVLYGGTTVGVTSAGTNGQIFLGVTGSAPAFATLGGDATITNAGVLTLGTGSVTSSKILDNTIDFVDISDTPTLDADTTAALAGFNLTLGTNAGNGTVLISPNAGGRAALTINKQGNNDIFTASAAGTTRLTLSNGGNLNLIGGAYQISGTSVIDASRNLNNIAGVTTSLTPTAANTYNLGTAIGNQYANIYGQAIYQNGNQVCDTTGNCSGLVATYWDQTSGALMPKNATVDLLVGGTATASSKFAVLNMNSGTPTASLSAGVAGGAYLTATGNLQTTTGQTLTIGGSTTGDIALSPINGSGKLSLNVGSLSINGTDGTTTGGSATCVTTINGIVTGTGTCAPGSGGSLWSVANGAVYPIYNTVDLLVGSNASASAKFAVLNVNSGTPTASVSAGTAGAAYLTAAGTLQTTAKQTLTLGGNTTGNITLDPLSGAGKVTSTGTLNLATGKTYQINGTDVLSATTLGTGVTGSSLTSVGTITSGTWNGTTVGTQYGGTGQNFSAVATGSLPYFSGTGTMSTLPIGSTDQILTVSGGLPAWISTSAINFWQRANGSIAPLNITDDLLLGATATSAAKIGFLNMAAGTPIASISANSGNNATFLTGAGNLGTSNAQTLALGGSTTGDITLSGRNGANNAIVFTGYATGLIHADANGRLTSSAINLAGADVTGTLGVTNGGTGVTSLTSNGVLYGGATVGVTAAGTTGTVLKGNTGSAPTFGAVDLSTDTTGILPTSKGGSYWTASNGGLYPGNSTYDLFVGGTSTNSAKFAVVNVNSGTPTASVSAGTNGAAYLTADGSLQTTSKQTLTLGGSTTGNIALSGFGAGVLHTNASGVLSSSAVNLASEVTGTLGATNGGTGQSTVTTGDLLYGSGTNTWSKLAVGSPGQVLSVSGGVPAWIATSSINFWQRADGALAPLNITDDLLLGSTATTSAKIGLLNIAGGTPTASLSANSGNNAVYLSGDGTLATTNKQSLTLGNSSTGNIILNGGRVGIGTTTPGAALDINGSVLVAGGGSIDTRASGTLTIGGTTATTLTLGRSGQGITLSGFASNQNSVLATGASGALSEITTTTSGLCLMSNSTPGTPSWQTCPGAGTNTNWWDQQNGTLYPLNPTVDLLVGGQATTSAKFAVLNVNSGTPTASVSAGINGAAFLTATGGLQTTAKQSLTLGGGGTGNIVLSGFGAGVLHSSAQGVLSSSAVDLASEITGTLGIFNGGTGTTTIGGAGSIAYSNGSSYAFSASGTSGQVLTSGGSGVPTWTDPTNVGHWDRANGAVYPKLASVTDLLLGSNATTSAKFAFKNVTSGTPTASISANSGDNATYLTGDGTLATTNRGNLTLGNSSAYNTTGNILLNPNGTGRVGIGTAVPGSFANGDTRLEIVDNDYARIGFVATDPATDVAGFIDARSDVVDRMQMGTKSNHGLSLLTNDQVRLSITSTGNIGIGTGDTSFNSTLGTFDVRSNLGTTPIATFSGATAHAAMVVDNSGVGDIFTASSSGLSRFTVKQNGNVGVGTTLPSALFDVNGTASISGGLKLYGSPTIQSTANQTLTIGGNTTGNIALTPDNGAGTVTVDGGLVLSSTSGEGISGAGLTDCEDTTSTFSTTEVKLQYDATTKQFSCASDGTTVTKIKGSNESVTSSTTLQNDDDLFFSIGANETWTFDITAVVASSATPDWKFDFSVPSGSTCFYSITGVYGDNAADAYEDSCTNSSIWTYTATTIGIYRISGTITNGANAGTVQLRWAQGTSSGSSATMYSYDSKIHAYKVTGADVAESYYTKDASIEPGDIVMADGRMQAGVQKSGRAYDGRTLGIISTQPGLVLGDDTRPEGKRVYLALNGRVPVKVNGENGPIKAGDYVTTSSTPGIAMKATKAGQMIGKALQDYNPSDPKATGKVLVFTNLTWADPSLTLTEDGNFHSDNMAIGAQPETQKEKEDLIAQLKDMTASISGLLTKQQTHDDKIQALEEKMDRQASESASMSAMTTFAAPSSFFTASTAAELNLDDAEYKHVTVADTLNVLGRSTLSNVGITGKLTTGLLTVNGLDDEGATAAATLNTSAGPLKFQSTGLNNVDFFNGKIVFNKDGSLTTKAAVTAKKFNVDTTDVLAASLGESTIPAGKTTVVIKTSAVTEKSKIFITPKTKTSLPLSVTAQDDGKSFTVEIETDLPKDLKFNWWIVN